MCVLCVVSSFALSVVVERHFALNKCLSEKKLAGNIVDLDSECVRLINYACV